MSKGQSKSMYIMRPMSPDEQELDDNEAQFFDQKMVQMEELNQVNEDDYHKKPFCSLVSIASQSQGVGFGSGVLISPNLILTVAHNIYDATEGGKNIQEYQKIKYLLAGKGEVNRNDYKDIRFCRYQRLWNFSKPSLAIKYDFCLLSISQEYDYDRCMELTICCQHCTFDLKKQQKLQIYGYPGEKNEQGIQNYIGFQQNEPFKLSQWGKIGQKRLKKVEFGNYRVCYQMTTFPGQSGTAVLYGGNLVAIHKAGGKKTESFNFRRMLTFDMVEKLVDWSIQIGAKPIKINDKNICYHLESQVRMLQKRSLKKSSKKIENIKQSSQGLLKENIELKMIIKDLQAKMQKQRIEGKRVIQSLKNDLKQFQMIKNKEFYLNWKNKQQNKVKQQVQPKLHSQESQEKEQQFKTPKKKIYQQEKPMQEYLNVNTKPDSILDLSYKGFQVVNLREYINLKEVYLTNNKLSSVDLSGSTELTKLWLENNLLAQINLSYNTKITHLYLQNNKINQIDLSKNIELLQLWASKNQLAQVDLSANTKLTLISLDNNKLQMVAMIFLSEMHWNVKNFSNGIFLFNQQSLRCEIFITYSKQYESKCKDFVQEGERGFAERNFIVKAFIERYWQNKYDCKYKFKMWKIQ